MENSDIDVVVKLKPEKPMRGCFEICQQGDKTFIAFQQIKDLDMNMVISDIVAELSNAS